MGIQQAGVSYTWYTTLQVMSEAVRDALAALRANRIALLSPDIAETKASVDIVAQALGLSVVAQASFRGKANHQIDMICPADVAAAGIALVRSAEQPVDVLFIIYAGSMGCNQLQAMEAELGVPVVTSKSALDWKVGSAPSTSKVGRSRLFSLPVLTADASKRSGATRDAPVAQLLAPCVRLISLAHAIRITATTSAGLPHLVCRDGAALAAAALLPGTPAVVIPALLCRFMSRLAKLPLMHDSQYWVCQMDLALIFAYGAVVCRRRPAAPEIGRPARSWARRWMWALLARLRPAEEAEVVARAQPIIRWQLFWFYLAAGVWKLNRGFLHPQYSCAPVFSLTLLDHLPPSWDAAIEPWAPLIAAASPAAVLGLELGVAVCLLLDPRRLGVLMVLLLHLGIAIVPPPNNIGCFGVQTCARLYLLMPRRSLAAWHEAIGRYSAQSALAANTMVAGAAAVLCALTHMQHEAGARLDLSVPLLVAMAVLYCRGLALHSTADDCYAGMRPRVHFPTLGVGGRAFAWLAFVYSFCLPMLGSDMVGWRDARRPL